MLDLRSTSEWCEDLPDACLNLVFLFRGTKVVGSSKSSEYFGCLSGSGPKGDLRSFGARSEEWGPVRSVSLELNRIIKAKDLVIAIFLNPDVFGADSSLLSLFSDPLELSKKLD